MTKRGRKSGAEIAIASPVAVMQRPPAPLELTPRDIQRHLAGEVTLGIYAINPRTQKVKWMAIDADYRKALEDLERKGRARLFDRYVSSEEERWCFQASDVVLLPYLQHYGTSGVLARAAAAGKPVIVSDEQLLGRFVREHRLGWVFPSGDAGRLAEVLRETAQLSGDQRVFFAERAADWAKRNSREAYRAALLEALRDG